MDDLEADRAREAALAEELAARLARAWGAPVRGATLDVDGVALRFVSEVRDDTPHARHSGWPDCQRWLEARRACAPCGRLAIRLEMPSRATPDHPLLHGLRARGVQVASRSLHVTTDDPDRFADVLALADVLPRFAPYVTLEVGDGQVVAIQQFWVGHGYDHQIASEDDARNVVALARAVAEAIDRVGAPDPARTLRRPS